MKKRLSVVLLCVMLVCSSFMVSGCGTKDSGKTKFAIVQLIENGAFNDMRDGIVEQLRNNGYTEDNSVIDIKCAQGDASTLQTIAQTCAQEDYKAIFTIATPTTQALVNQETKTPVFFCAVSAPVAAGVISDMDHPDKNATGTSNAIPVADIFSLAKKLTPEVKTYGFLYCTSEDNSVNTIKAAKKYCDDNSIKYVEATVTNSSEVAQAAQILADKADAVFIPNDSVIQSAMTQVTEVARNKKIPVYGSSATMVNSGAFATIAISDVEIGKMTVDIAMQYVKDGKKIEEIKSVVVPASNTVVNETTLNAIDIKLSDEIKKECIFVKDTK